MSATSRDSRAARWVLTARDDATGIHRASQVRTEQRSTAPADLLFVVGEVAADRGKVERGQDRLLRLAFEKELEAPPDETLRISAARGEPLEVDAQKRDGVPSLVAAIRNRNVATPAIGRDGASNVDISHCPYATSRLIVAAASPTNTTATPTRIARSV